MLLELEDIIIPGQKSLALATRRNLVNIWFQPDDGRSLYRGEGEIFDLSLEPPAREKFAFDGEAVNSSRYRITSKCKPCGLCIDACPVDVISEGDIYLIDFKKNTLKQFSVI